MINLRLDRFATLYLSEPLRRWSGRDQKPRIPILMYHSISEEMQQGIHPYYEITTTPDVFDQQMRYLSDNQYQTINLNDIEPSFLNGEVSPAKCVVVTFDDGYRDFFTNAVPILERYGFSATMFLPTASIGDEANLMFNERPCLSWGEVRSLHEKGTTFGSHTVSHPELKYLKKDEVEFELSRSKEIIEDKLGESIDSFSYPYAFPEVQHEFKADLREALQKYGYKSCVSTIIGTVGKGSDPFELKRIPVNDHDDPKLFEAKLSGAYDWMQRLQYAKKWVRSKVKNLK